MPARAVQMPLGKAPPLGEPPAPPLPHLRAGQIKSRATKLKRPARRADRRGPITRAAAQSPAVQEQAVQRAATTQARATAKAQQRAQPRPTGPRAAPPTRKLEEEAPHAPHAAPVATTPRPKPKPQPKPGIPFAPPAAAQAAAQQPQPRPGHVTLPNGRQVGHLRGPAHNAPANPQPQPYRGWGSSGPLSAAQQAASSPKRGGRPPKAPKAPKAAQPPAPTQTRTQRLKEELIKRAPQRLRDRITWQQYEKMFGEIAPRELPDQQIAARLDFIHQEQQAGNKDPKLVARRAALNRELRRRQQTTQEQQLDPAQEANDGPANG